MLIVIDTETTSLHPHEGGGVWDLAAVAVRDGEIVGRFSTLCWPGRKALQPENRAAMERISGFDCRRLLDEDVPEVATAKLQFLSWLAGNVGAREPDGPALDPAPPTLCRVTSYNAPFDRGWLDAQPWELAWFARAHRRVEVQWAECLMEAAMRAMGLSRWPKLSAAAAHFGIPFETSHRALADAEAAARLAIVLGVA